jgi:hypothetical protein
MRTKIKSVNVALTTDTSLPAYDNTKLVAGNTCPRWGILRYQMHKVHEHSLNSRAMALEAGSACHEVFAAVRLYQLYFYDTMNNRSPLHGNDGRAERLFDLHGMRLFGEGRWALLKEVIENASKEDEHTRFIRFALTALETSGFYDDPRDKRRTMSNLEEACLAYIDRRTTHRA